MMGYGRLLRHRDHRGRHPRPGHRPRARRARAGGAARHSREGSQARDAPNRQQLGRHPLRHLLQAGLLQGQALRRGQGVDARILQKTLHPRRSRREGDRRDQPGRAAASADPLRARGRQRGAGRDAGAGAAAGDRAARQRAARDPVPLDGDRRLQRGVRGDDAGADRPRRRDRDGRPRDLDRARRLVNCAGLYSDVVARLAGARVDVQIIPFRGEYYMIRPERQDIVRGLIYPVPDPEFPFLGVHLTRTVHGEVEAGPNAVLAFAREGYRFGRVSPSELAGTLAYRGFWQMARRYWRMGSYEMYRSLSKGAFVHALQRLVPALRPEDVTRGGAGVRAQAVSPDGSLVDDFRIVAEADAIHVLNAPSPGATASLAIGRHIAGLAVETFGLK